MAEVFNSALSSILATTATHPLELIKVRLQVAQQTNAPYVSTRQHFVNHYRAHGLSGFYKGLTPNIGSYPIFWSLYFPMKTYGESLQLFDSKYGNKCFVSTLAATTASAVSNPFFTVKVKMQTSDTNTTALQVTRQIYRQEGIRGFFKGLGATTLSNKKYAVLFPLYDYLREKTDNVLLASFSSKAITSSTFYPYDVIRNSQRDSITKLPLTHVCRNIYANNGIKGFYRGLGIYNVVSGLNFVLMMIIKDSLIPMWFS